MIDLYTAATPNGHKISIALEEMQLDYQVHHLLLDKLDQKQASFLKLNPNGRIPAIVDKANEDFAVFESGAILIYLAERTGKFIPSDPKERSRCLQWLMFQMSGVGPMQGQANVFFRYAPERIAYAIDRYQKETRRLYSVLDTHLQGREYLANEYSIADMATYPWVVVHEWAGVSMEGLSHLEAWMNRLGDRAAVQKGMSIPETMDTSEQGKDALKQKAAKTLV